MLEKSTVMEGAIEPANAHSAKPAFPLDKTDTLVTLRLPNKNG
jgi:hypothetical protein